MFSCVRESECNSKTITERLSEFRDDYSIENISSALESQDIDTMRAISNSITIISDMIRSYLDNTISDSYQKDW